MKAYAVHFNLLAEIEVQDFFTTREKAVEFLNSGGYHFVKNKQVRVEEDNEKRYYKDDTIQDFAQIKEITIH